MATIIPIADYPVRPAMEQGESLAGYVCRVHGANGCSINATIFDMLARLYSRRQEVAERAIPTVQPLLGDNTGFDLQGWLNHPQLSENCQQSWVKRNFNQVRLCPICLHEKGFHFAFWELFLVYACPFHNCALLTACTACGKAFEWKKIVPGWQCQCGQEITAMQAAPAKAGRVALAKLIAYATDITLPISMKCRFGKSTYQNYSLSGLYEALDWGSEVARGFSASKDFMVEQSGHKKNIKNIPIPTVAWAARLLHDPEPVLVKRVNRWLLRNFNKSQSLLISIDYKNRVGQAVNFINDKPDSYFKTKLINAFNQSMDTCRCELPLNLIVIFDPRYSANEIKACLINFAEWWGKLSSKMATLDGSVQVFWDHNYRSSYGPNAVGHQVLEIVKILLKASHENIDVGAFNVLSHWWRIPEILRNPDPPEDALYLVAVHLTSVSLAELNCLNDWVKIGCGQGEQ